MYWCSLVVEDFQKERIKVQESVCALNCPQGFLQVLKIKSPYFTKNTTDIVYIDILISILMSESKTIF